MSDPEKKRALHYEIWHSALVVWITAAVTKPDSKLLTRLSLHSPVIWRTCTEDISMWQIYKSCALTLRNSGKCFLSTSYYHISLRCTVPRRTSSDHCNLRISMWYYSIIHRLHGVGKYPPILPSCHLTWPGERFYLTNRLRWLMLTLLRKRVYTLMIPGFYWYSLK